jgi:hypothetical protein
MEVINEQFEMKNEEQLPKVLMRIFSVCKADPHFPIKSQMESIEIEVDGLYARIEKQKELVKQTIQLREELELKLKKQQDRNFAIRSRLLEEMGSEI